MNPQIVASIKRAAFQIVLAAAPIVLVFVADLEKQYIAYAVPLAIAGRVLEGVFDGLRNRAGDIKPGDVGAFSAPLSH